jgi:general secretion pathway protein G
VAVVLAIFAAIVVPQFASTTDEAKDSALKSDLAAMRAAIDLYRQQHGEYPGAVASTGGTCTGGTAGTGALETEAAFFEQLAFYTNATGQSCTRPVGGNFPYGPYLREASMPENVVTGVATVVVVGAGDAAAGDLSMAGDAANQGWKYDVVSGKLIVNDTSNDNLGVPYDSY